MPYVTRRDERISQPVQQQLCIKYDNVCNVFFVKNQHESGNKPQREVFEIDHTKLVLRMKAHIKKGEGFSTPCNSKQHAELIMTRLNQANNQRRGSDSPQPKIPAASTFQSQDSSLKYVTTSGNLTVKDTSMPSMPQHPLESEASDSKFEDSDKAAVRLPSLSRRQSTGKKEIEVTEKSLRLQQAGSFHVAARKGIARRRRVGGVKDGDSLEKGI